MTSNNNYGIVDWEAVMKRRKENLESKERE